MNYVKERDTIPLVQYNIHIMSGGPEAENVTESGVVPPEIPVPFSPPNPDLSGPSTSRPSIARLDNVFNFQIVVFQVEDCLFQVLRNGFNVPGTIFEAMFSLPTPGGEDDSLLEGNSLEHPIVLEGVEARHFRVFLRVLYPFISQSDVTSYDDWISVLHLATMWDFRKIRATAINHLSSFLAEKPAPEKIYIGRKYRVIDWVKEGYKTLCRDTPSTLEEMCKPADPFSLDWEAVARVYFVREKLRREITGNQHCGTCAVYYGPGYSPTIACSCRYATAIDEVFRSELTAMKDIEPSESTFTTRTINGKGAGKKKAKRT